MIKAFFDDPSGILPARDLASVSRRSRRLSGTGAQWSASG